jgi:hypothetical protein
LKQFKTALCPRILLGVVSLSAVACSPVHKQAEIYPPRGWHKLDAGSFSIYAPAGWEFRTTPSVDSFTGRFEGDGVRLGFVFGLFAESVSDSQQGPTYLVSDESIGGLPAKLQRPRTPGRGRTAIYFPRVRGSEENFYLCGQDLTTIQQKLVLEIFRTIRFEDTNVPR